MPSVPVPPDYVTNGYGFPMQTTSCTWPYVVPIGEDPAAHGHWCAVTDLYHAIPYPPTAQSYVVYVSLNRAKASWGAYRLVARLRET